MICSQVFDPEPGWRGMNFARWLKNNGCEVEVLTGFPNYPLGKVYKDYKMRWFEREEMDGISILRVPLYPSHDSSFLRRAISYFSFMISAICIGASKTRKADVVYIYNLPTVALVALWLKLTRKTPYVFNIPDIWPDSVIESGMIKKRVSLWFAQKILSWWLIHITYRNASVITVLSEGFKRILVARGVPEDKIVLVYNWADDNLFRPVPVDQKLRNELGFTGYFNFVYAGNVGAMQNVGTLIRAAKKLNVAGNKIRLNIIGTGQSIQETKRLAAELDVSNVRFLEWRDSSEMLPIYAMSDVLIIHLRDIPLFETTIPGKTQVSLAVGRPILMAVPGEAQEIILKAKAGMICEPENVQMMANVMEEMADLEHDVLKRMGNNAREFYEREMAESVGAPRMHNALLRACHRTS